MTEPADRLQRLTDQFFPALNEKLGILKAHGADVVRLDMGSPDLPPAPWIVDALVEAARKPHEHGYQPGRSTASLRMAWAAMYQRDHHVSLDPDLEVLPLIGSKEGIFHLALAMLNPGDVVLLPDPGYLTYRQGALCAEAIPYSLPLLPENNFLPDLEHIPANILKRARILWLNYPHNPTAGMASIPFFTKAVDFAREYNLLLCHDAAYVRVVYDGLYAPSLLEVPGAKEVAIEFNSLSKTYNMAGWRVGAVVGQAQALQTLFRLKAIADSGHFGPIQTATESALLGDQAWVNQRNFIYQQRRDLVLSHLTRLGFVAAPSQAALYIWFRTPPGWTSTKYTDHLLEKAHVSLAPGIIFGDQGEYWIRLAFTTPEDRLQEALYRIEKYL